MAALRSSSRRAAALAICLVPACLAASAALGMRVSFSWHGIAACQRVSPAFSIVDAPTGTRWLRFVMHDRQAPHFHHGGSTVDYSGPTVPPGAIHYIGPCPPEGETHHYVWTIEALDAKGHVIAKTTSAGDFPAK